MRRLFGVVLLAAVPIACGTSLPTVPSAAPTDAVVSAEVFAASARGVPPTCTDKGDWSSVSGVVLNVARSGRGWATVRTEFVILGRPGPIPCFTTTFSVDPVDRGVVLQPEADAREATLRAPSGKYQISVVVAGPARPLHTASLLVELPGE